jgi:mRNA-degrading endonuclease toxin of MazEF toxin-antitoxin module
MPPGQRFPQRGEIWWTNFHTDPDKGRRPVIFVSPNARNQHERATTVLVVPLSTSIHKLGPAHMLLHARETGLRMDYAAQADNIAAVLRANLRERSRDNASSQIPRFANWPRSQSWQWAALRQQMQEKNRCHSSGAAMCGGMSSGLQDSAFESLRTARSSKTVAKEAEKNRKRELEQGVNNITDSAASGSALFGTWRKISMTLTNPTFPTLRPSHNMLLTT